MEAVIIEAQKILYNRYLNETDFVEPTGSVHQRLRMLIDVRFKMWEDYAHYMRTVHVQKWKYERLEKYNRQLNNELSVQLSYNLPEVRYTGDWMFDLTTIMLSFETWDRMFTVEQSKPEKIKERVFSVLAPQFEDQ